MKKQAVAATDIVVHTILDEQLLNYKRTDQAGLSPADIKPHIGKQFKRSLKADEPIVLPTEELTVTKNKQFVFSTNVYNENFETGVTGTLICPAGGGAEAIPNAAGIGITSGPQDITAGEDKGFKFIIDKELVKKSATRICTISFSDENDNKETKQVVVSIK